MLDEFGVRGKNLDVMICLCLSCDLTPIKENRLTHLHDHVCYQLYSVIIGSINGHVNALNVKKIHTLKG